jgi:hypothetical protein
MTIHNGLAPETHYFAADRAERATMPPTAMSLREW